MVISRLQPQDLETIAHFLMLTTGNIGKYLKEKQEKSEEVASLLSLAKILCRESRPQIERFLPAFSSSMSIVCIHHCVDTTKSKDIFWGKCIEKTRKIQEQNFE